MTKTLITIESLHKSKQRHKPPQKNPITQLRLDWSAINNQDKNWECVTDVDKNC